MAKRMAVVAERLKTMGAAPLAVASCLVFDERGRLLLLKRHPDDLGGGKWSVPGGRQDPHEDPAVTAMRELQEETGIAAAHVTFLGIHEICMPHGTIHMQTFKTTVAHDTGILLNSDEHQAFRWFTLAELMATKDIIWALPTTMRDFGLMTHFDTDPTLADGSTATLLASYI